MPPTWTCLQRFCSRPEIWNYQQIFRNSRTREYGEGRLLLDPLSERIEFRLQCIGVVDRFNRLFGCLVRGARHSSLWQRVTARSGFSSVRVPVHVHVCTCHRQSMWTSSWTWTWTEAAHIAFRRAGAEFYKPKPPSQCLADLPTVQYSTSTYMYVAPSRFSLLVGVVRGPEACRIPRIGQPGTRANDFVSTRPPHGGSADMPTAGWLPIPVSQGQRLWKLGGDRLHERKVGFDELASGIVARHAPGREQGAVHSSVQSRSGSSAAASQGKELVRGASLLPGAQSLLAIAIGLLG